MSQSDNTPTVLVSSKAAKQQPAKNLFDDVSPKPAGQGSGQGDSFRQKTVFYGEGAVVAPADAAGLTILAHGVVADREGTSGQDFMHDPVVGWVVVIQGAGKGKSLPLGYGTNALGRAASQRVCLDFGDRQISRENHALITYEPKGRVFYLQNGGGVNLTYLQTLDGSVLPVLTPLVLEHGQCIQLGDTTLKFMALCGSQFDWNDLA
ncbi:MAG: FHA domain-containing protein [Candidatus Thiothrix moscowensis]|nr:FHA domain-containing protein [Candidatus Thiothrix moscowensis]